jgi:hypothetical protein
VIQCLGPTLGPCQFHLYSCTCVYAFLDVGYVTDHVSVAWHIARASTGCVLLTKRVRLLRKRERGFIHTQFSDPFAALDACY